jgi:hypothetical protein
MHFSIRRTESKNISLEGEKSGLGFEAARSSGDLRARAGWGLQAAGGSANPQF